MIFHQNIEEMAHLFRCLECGAPDLKAVQSDKKSRAGYVFQGGKLALACSICNSRYPITEDGIPILWTREIKEILSVENAIGQKRYGCNGVGKALYSNISSYDRISDDYSENWRRDDTLAKRIRAGASQLVGQKTGNENGHPFQEKYHLDVGCGPGHVLGWLGGLGCKQVGLDVSLANLRNARKRTGAYVVLGDGTAMPFKDDVFSLVTGSAVLHHIYDWKKAVLESCRVCSKAGGGVMYDSEPTVESLCISRLAGFVFEMRWPAYKVLSYLDSSKMHFRNIGLAKEYYRTAEVHNQPGRGISVREVEAAFRSAGFSSSIFMSPNESFQMRNAIPWREAGWKRLVLHLLSGHNPLLAKYGSFTVLAVPSGQKTGE